MLKLGKSVCFAWFWIHRSGWPSWPHSSLVQPSFQYVVFPVLLWYENMEKKQVLSKWCRAISSQPLQPSPVIICRWCHSITFFDFDLCFLHTFWATSIHPAQSFKRKQYSIVKHVWSTRVLFSMSFFKKNWDNGIHADHGKASEGLQCPRHTPRKWFTGLFRSSRVKMFKPVYCRVWSKMIHRASVGCCHVRDLLSVWGDGWFNLCTLIVQCTIGVPPHPSSPRYNWSDSGQVSLLKPAFNPTHATELYCLTCHLVWPSVAQSSTLTFPSKSSDNKRH
jgi:hypothetical protein